MSSVIQYYPLDVGTNSGTNIANLTIGSNVFDASLNGGAYISTSNFRIGKGALATDTSGQYVRINNSLTTTSAGLTFSLWTRGNNGVGQYTLLDYSNGPGGNNRISLGLQNNTLLGQVVNGTSIGSLTFTTPTSTSLPMTYMAGLAYSTSADRFVFTDSSYLYFRKGLTGADTSFGPTYNYIIGVCLTSDGSRVVWSLLGGDCYYATWDGTTYSGITTINSGASTGIQNIDMTDDGQILTVAVGNLFTVGVSGIPLWAYWTGSGYSTYRTVSGVSTSNHNSIAITTDGNRIAFSTIEGSKPTLIYNIYYATWNGTTYSNTTLFANNNLQISCMKFSKDGNILFIASGSLKYYIWNGSSFGSVQFNSGLDAVFITNLGLCIDYNNTIFGCSYSANMYKTTFNVSNQYTASNFYSAQNLNDNAWRHVAWTIDPTNTTYKYYINGAVIKTDTSANYTFPAATTRTNNLLANSTDLSLSFFTGGIDNYKVYSGVLTDAQVSALFKSEAYNGLSQIQYYTFDTTAFSSNNLGNYVSGSYIYDASLNAYQSANLVKNGEFNNATTGWTTSGSVSTATFGTTYRRENIPYNITTFGYLNTSAGSYLSQTITFPKAGNYVLTFYSSRNNGVCTLQLDIGTLYSKTYSYSDYYWAQTTVPFYVSAAQTQTLKLTMATGTQQIWLTGIVIQNTDNYVSTTGFRSNQGSLSLDTSGQIVKMNAPFTTTSSGLTFALWARGNNGVGQNTLLDYSNGPGANNRISLGLQNNTLLAQVVNGTSLGTVSFTALTNSSAANVSGIAYSSSANRLVWINYVSGVLYYRTGLSGTDTQINGTAYTASTLIDLCMTNDGNRIVFTARSGKSYFATWNGSNYTGFQTVNAQNISSDFQSIDITEDGGILVAAIGAAFGSGTAGVPIWAKWNGTNYSAYSNTLNMNLDNYTGIAISPDGSRIAYTTYGKSVYYAVWNGTNYSDQILIGSVLHDYGFKLKFSKDGNILFVASYLSSNGTGALQYCLWNGTTFGTLNNSGLFSTAATINGMALDYNNNMFIANLNLGIIYKTTFNVSNQYTASNFYSAQNLNDNTWRHIAWTIDPTTTTYKYYINGSLIKTDTSANYTFPAPTTRTNNLLATSADLPLSYFVGGIDNYQSYNGVLSDAEILALYKVDAYSTQTPVEYYTGDFSSVTDISYSTMTNSITGVGDALLMGGSSITTTNYITGITSTGSGQYVKIISPLTTTATSSGLTFSFWFRSKNGSGINPLLDYSIDKGNNKVALALWNGSPYAQVISDASLGTITLTTDAGFSKTNTGNVFGMTLSANHQRMAIITTTGVYYATYSAGAWSAFTALETATITGGGIAMSSDGSRIVWNRRNAYTYFSKWNSTTSTYGTATQTLDTIIRTFTNMHMTADGSRIVACGGYESAILYADWNGTNFSAFTTVPPITNTIFLTGSTNASATWGTPSAGNVFLNSVTQPETYYVWATSNSATTAFSNDDTRPIIFEYNYNNTTGSSITATLYYIIDTSAYFYLNGVIQNAGLVISGGNPNGGQIAITLPTGNNRFQFACINDTASPAAFAVIVKSNTGTLLFNTNATNSGWTITNPYCGVAITPDGNRIFYGIQVLTGNQTTTNSLYYADWDSTKNNYGSGTLIGAVNSNTANYLRNIRCSPDGNIVFVSSTGTSFIAGYVFNGTTFVAQNTLSVSTNDVYALDTVWDGPNKYLYVGYATSLTRYTYTASNTYTSTNFYTSQNLNDDAWRHFAWTIDPSTTTYKYYLNGTLIKTDTSTNFVFPSPTTRTNNLLLTSTDLPLSYYVGSIDNYRAYTGVLTDTQINTLFKTDTYGGQFQNYSFNQGTNSGVNLVNDSTNLYDASLNGGAYISTTNYITGTGGLSLDTSGQYVKMNNTLTTASNTGLTFSLWVRGNNGVGQNTLLDYSNGSGGNQKISLGIQNNTLLAQVVNGTTLNPLTFTNYTEVMTAPAISMKCLCLTADGKRLICSDYDYGNLYTYIYSNGSWTGPVVLAVDLTPVGLCCTADGNRLVIARYDGKLVYVTWNGKNYANITITGFHSSTLPSPQTNTADMTPDGRILLISCGNISTASYVYYSIWNDSTNNYTTFTKVNNILGQWVCCAITADGSRIAFSKDTFTYYSVWNNTTQEYGTPIRIGTITELPRQLKFSKDGNILFELFDTVTSTNIFKLKYSIWDGTSYSNLFNIQSGVVPDSPLLTLFNLAIGWDNSIYICRFSNNSTNISRFTFNVSNQYTATNFYNTDNLNDNQWRHIAWTIDPSNTTYKYYINGALIYTDISANYTFPASTSRTNNLLGVSTDLSMSYMTGGIDQYRVQSGVLTDAQIYSLFQSDAYSNHQLIQYYTFDPSFNTGTNLANLYTNSTTGVYDASLNGGAYISTTNKKIGAGALAIDASGQSVRFNSQIPFSNKGQSFAFWARGNNGVGQNTLLDYSNGPGGNNRISLGLQNNTLYSQVVNGTSLGTVSFTTAQSTTIATGYTGVAYSKSADRFVMCKFSTGNIYFRQGITGADTSFATQANVISICITSDGSRVVWSLRAGSCSYATWNGTTYSNITTINSGTLLGIQGIDMTDDGQILLVSVGINGSGSNGVPNWAYWTGSGYSTYIPILNATTTNHICCGITTDGSRIAFADFTSNNLYYATWNGTNYSNPKLITNTGSTAYCLRFSKDGNILFVTLPTNVLNYFIWNGSSFGSIQYNAVLNSMGNNPYGLCLDYNNTIYGIGFNASSLNKTTFNVSNQYTTSNFYSAQNLNDNTWRHIAWTIDPSNTTYKYYINGALIYTDISSGYAFPAPTTRKNNLLLNSTDLSLSYFIGGMDNYRMYSGVLTDAQIAVLAAETVPEGTLTTLYPFDTAAVSGGTNIANYASGSYVYDASLNSGATISTVNYKVGVGSLSLDTSGQTMKINTSLTNTTGLSFLFWQRATNGTGQTTLLDYSGGPGGNQKITYGLQNNQIYAQVTNGTTVGTLTFSTAQTASLIANAVAIAYAPTTNKMVYATTTGVLYLRAGGITNMNDSVAVSGTYPGINNLFLTSDGNRLVWSVRGGDAYFAQMNGSVFSDPQVINTGALAIQGMDLTDDGSVLAVVCGNVFGGTSGSLQWAYWTGSQYSTYKTITNTTVGDFVSCAMTPDGSRITYLEFTTNKLYYALWNGTNYVQNNTSWTIPTGCRNMKMSKDGNILFLTYPGTTNVLRYSVWDGTTMTINLTTVFDSVVQCWGLWVDYNNAIYTIDYNNTVITTGGISSATATLYKTTFQASNQYTATHFYAQENLNNSVWRQCAWTIDPYTSTYKYYINGTLVKTDTSSNYVFPAIASRSRNQLGVSTDLSLSYFKGKLDYYRVYNGILTDAQIATAYQNEMYSFQPLAQYFTLDTNTTELVQNGYFSLPNMAGGYNSTGAPTGWNYVRVTTPSDGYQFTSGNIASGGIGVNTPIPAGALQYIFLQNNGSNINQDITFPCAGNYLLTYYASARSGNTYSNIQVRVNIGTAVFDKITPLITNNWVKYSVSFYVSSACTQNLKFQDYSPTYNDDGPLLVGISIVSDNNKSLANYATGVCAYDASLYTGTTVNTNQYKTGAGSLSFDVKGQFSQLSPLTTTANTGLSFSFWAKANNKCGYYTLLDYSNGPGGNQKISLGLQNNTLLGQVVNGTSLGSLTFSTAQTARSTINFSKVSYSSSADRFVLADNYAGTLYFRSGYTGVDISFAPLDSYFWGLRLTNDGSRVVWSIYNDNCYYATWNGTTYSNITVINSGVSTGFRDIDLTDDGQILVVARSNNSSPGLGPVWAYWTGSGYSTYRTIPNETLNYSAIAITTDGNRIAYASISKNIYYATWDGTNFSNPTLIDNVGYDVYSMRFSKDGNILFLTIRGTSANTNTLRYIIWNGSSFGSIQSTNVFNESGKDLEGLCVDYNNTIYGNGHPNFSNLTEFYLFKTTFQVSNQYTSSNFYSTQNLNDNTWRHYAWTIDPTNTTYRYYMNGSLVYTDISSGYAFPASTTRTNNLLGTSTDLSMSYMTGAIDNYRVYNGVLTPREISAMYNYENTGTKTLLSYYPLDALSYAESYVGNYTTGTYVYDATMVGGATITTKSNPPVGTKALNLDVSGQYLRMNPSFTTTNAGLTFSLWFKGNNGVGQYTLLDYSNGPGGNNRISLGLQNNTLLGQVVNGTTIGTVSFTTLFSTFSPTNIAGNLLWFDANDSSYITKTGNNVTVWRNKSGTSGRDATPFIGTSVTYNNTGLNGLPTIQFTTNNALSCPLTAGVLSGGTTCFVIFQKTTGSNTYEALITRTNGANPAPFDIWEQAGYLQRYLGNGTQNSQQQSTFSIINSTTPTMMSFTIDSTSKIWKEYKNGTSIFTSTAYSFYGDTASSFYIGTRADQVSRFTGNISEILVYNSVLTDTNRQQIEGYLAWKWGLQTILPTSHPYYSYSYTGMIGLAYTGSTVNRFIYTDYGNNFVKFRTGITGTDTTVGTTFQRPIDVRVTSDGSRIVWTCRNDYCYYATWNGQTYTNIQTVNSSEGIKGFQGMDMTDDGQIIVLSVGSAGVGTNGVPLWAYWTGSGYSSYRQTLNTTVSSYVCCAITVDGNKIAYVNLSNNSIYYATWNGTNYTDGINIGTFTGCRMVRFSKDGNILFVMGYNDTYSLQYYLWNGTTYTLIASNSSLFGINYDVYGMVVDYDNNIYATRNGSGLYQTSFNIANQYTATNFYSAQNLNDNSWRHVAWTIDPTNTRYKYYINGTLIKTDTSANYSFPASTTRTNNLLGTSTDLSMSYMIGNLSQYRVQSGVLTDAQIYALYTADAYNSQSTIQYYPFDTASLSGTNLGNYASNAYYVMDASLNGGATISSSNSVVGTGALSLDISGQFVRLNNNLTTSIGLSFTFWMRGNNAVGQYTLLDYSNGPGGNQKISLGLQNNTLLAQVVNGTTLGTVSFTELTSSSVASTSVTGIAYSSSANRLVWLNIGSGFLYYRTGLSGTDTQINGTAYPGIIDVCMTNDGNRIVFTARSGKSYFATWNGSTNYTGFQTVNAEATTRSFQSIDITEDGGILVAAIGAAFGSGTAGVPIWAKWNGTNYSAYTAALNTVSDNYTGIAISPDGSRIAYTTYGKSVYYAVWNGTNYSDRILIGSVLHDYGFKLKFSKDGNILFVASYLSSNGTGALQYCLWNGTTFGTLNNSGLFSTAATINGMALDYNNNIYIGNYSANVIYKTTFQVSNQYSASNFYSAQNLNDNTWRHVAWTIDPTNTTYKYYINGTLIKTDISAGYAFPGLTTRTNNLLGTSTDLSMSYMTGGIDNYRVYNGVLTDAQVNSLFTADAYKSQSLIQYYPFDTASLSGTNLGNYVSNTYVMDASLNGGATISTSNAIVGTGALSLDISGHFLRLNNKLITSSAGLTFAFWFKARNGVGQNTLLDYSNGSGGNNKITMGIQNNTLYGQVVNGTGLNALTSFTPYTSSSFLTTVSSAIYGLCMTDDAQRLSYCDINTNNIYTHVLVSGTWTLKDTFSVGSSPVGICCTADGSRLVISRRTGVLVFATWNGTGYSGLTNTGLVGNPDGGPSMTPDGKILVVARGNTLGVSTVVYSFWTGTNYTTFNDVSTTSRQWLQSAITTDGSRVAYVSANGTQSAYVSFWNNSTQSYGNETALTTFNGTPYNVSFSKDGNILILGNANANAATGYQYAIWNGTAYSSLVSFPSGTLPISHYCVCAVMDWNNNLYTVANGTTTIYKTTFKVSNQYTATNFYTQQNLNDNSWRHIAWTIDPSNTTYKYYINGALVKTDTSANYTFPALTTRTNNLLGTSTDLSLSYMTGGIDNYRVYNGVLTDTQVYSLFTADAYNNQSLIQYYSFDTTFSSGTVALSSGVYGYANIANSAKGSIVYDASLNGGARLNSTNYSVGNASLELTGTGNHVRMNNSLTTSGIGMSFAFWIRGNNGVGQYTLLDYSNGSGANNKISLGLQNNTLLAQVVNGTSLGTVSFTALTNSSAANVSGIAYSSSANRLVWINYVSGVLYYRTGLSGTDTQINGTAYTASTLNDLCMTNDGNRIVFTARSGLSYFATWNGSTNYTGFQTVNVEATTRSFQSIDITEDGGILVAAIGAAFGSGTAGVPIWAKWNGTNYSAYTAALNTVSDNYTGIAISPDGSRIAYTTYGKSVYYAVWNGTNYSDQILIGSVLHDYGFKLKFSKDGNILFVASYLSSNGTGALQYCLWNGTAFGTLNNSGLFSSPSTGIYGMALDYNNNMFIANLNLGIIYKTTFQVSNQYTATNFYTQQNLNDNSWRHIAWTIDPSNTTYKYYINGTLIKTDISAGYAFPAPTTRTNNLLGTSTDLSMSYMTGGIDNYRVYNGVLTHAQILELYNTEGYSNAITTSTGAALVQYYPFNSNKWSVQPALSANYSLVHQYTFDYHTFNECMVLNTANYTPVYDCRLTNSSTTAPLLDTTDYKVGTSSMYFSANTLFLQVNGVQISASSGVSIACWFKYTSGQLFDFGNNGMDNLSYSPATGITFKNGLTSYTINGGTGKADTTWHHFAWTISSTGSHIVYIDGAVSATTASVAPVSGTRINNYIGKGVGRVDDFRVYSGVLTLTDIQNLYNLLPITSSLSMVNYYPLDYAQIDNGFVPNMASGYSVYDAVLCNGTTSIPTVDISNNRLGTACLYLPGTNQYAQIRQVNVNNTGMTIAVWLKVAVSPTGVSLYKITDFGTGTTGAYDNYGIYISNTVIGSHVYIGTTNNTVSFATTTHIDLNWHHLALTMTYSATNTSTHVLYLDGTAVATSTSARYPVVGIRANNRIGCSVIGGEFVNGYLDDLRVYNGVMSSTEISALYSLTQYDKVVKIPNLSNHYTFEPTMVGGNYVANMSSNTVKYDMVFGPGLLPTLDATAGNFKQGLRGLRLDGANKQYVQLNNFSVPSSVGLTIACWFKYTSANGSRLFDFCNTINTGSDIIAYSPSGGLDFRVGTTVQNTGASSGKADGTWHHFAWSMAYVASGNTTHKVYIDGTPTTYTTWLYPTVGTRISNYIGKSSFTANDYATGYVDDFRIYYGVLSDAEITGIVGSSTYSTSIQPAIYYTFE